jgi:hypothetical protein
MFCFTITQSFCFSELIRHNYFVDINLPAWQEDDQDGHRTRMISYRISLNYSIGPKSSQASEQQTCYKDSKPGSLYVVDSECNMSGIPYADTFSVIFS